MKVRDGKFVISGRGRCVGWHSYYPNGLAELISYYLFDLKYKTIWEQGSKRTTCLASYDDILRDVREYP